MTENGQTQIIDYLGGFQYLAGKLDFLPHAEGYVKAVHTGSATEYHYVYNYTDHTSTTLSTGLGNIRLSYGRDPVTGEIAILKENHYYPFGLEHQGYVGTHKTIGIGIGKVRLVPVRNYLDDSYRYTFGGKEEQPELGLNWMDFHARNYDAALGRTMTVDPLADDPDQVDKSPYAAMWNNPIRYVDPLGLKPDDWVERTDKDGNKSIVWDENVTSADDKDLQKGDRYLGKAVVVFEGSEDEKLGKGDNLFGEGANLAKVTVYGPDGEDDIKEYGGYTMSSDPSKYGTVADGEYNVYYDKVGKSGALKSNWAVEGRGNVPARNGVNPAFPNRKPGYLNGVFIHRSNNSGYAGGGVSKGCPLICPSLNNPGNGWDEFNNQLRDVKEFKMILKRN